MKTFVTLCCPQFAMFNIGVHFVWCVGEDTF